MRFLLLAIALTTTASAREIAKQAEVTDKGMRFYWWPKLQIPNGWKHDEKTSKGIRSNVLIPKGKRFANAETIFYARAFYAPNPKKRGTLKQFIERDVNTMLREEKRIRAREVAPMKTANQTLRTYSFINPKATSERVCYGAEGDFWIEFVISSRTEAALERDLPLFAKMLAAYK